MRLSVVIPCYNAAETISALLDALAEEHWDEPWEIVIADNGSTDETLAIVGGYDGRLPNLRVVDASARRGAQHALNAGARAATGEAVAFCGADDVVGAGWVEAIGAALSSHDFVASRHDPNRLNPQPVIRSRSCAQEKGLQRVWYPPYLPHAGGCGLGVKRALFEAIGGFDDELRYLQDTDLCLRLQRAGVRLHFVPDAVVHIRYRDTELQIFRQARVWALYNTLMYKRYRPGDDRMPDAWRRYLRGWIWLLRRAGRLRAADRRPAFFWQLGWQIGLLQGAIRHRVEPVVYDPEVAEGHA